MKGKVKKSALVCAALKAGQQVLHDLDSVVMNNTVIDVARYATEQYVCRLGSPLVAAYAIDKGLSYLEELILPKSLRGALPIALATLGTATAINYLGNYFNIEQSLGFKETLLHLLYNYKDSLEKITILSPEAHAGYLLGAALTVKSGFRWFQNMGETIAHYSEKRKVKRKYQEEREIDELKNGNKNRK